MLIKIDPKNPKKIIGDRINSMLDKVRRTGTSQDKDEWVRYSNSTTYKGFACIIAEVPHRAIKGYKPGFEDKTKNVIRYKGIAKEINPPLVGMPPLTIETLFAKDIMTAGQDLYNRIDIYRKAVKN
jgi:hypothetical protein